MQVEQEAFNELGRLERMPEVVLEHSMAPTRLDGLAERRGALRPMSAST